MTTTERPAYWQNLGIPGHIATSEALAAYWQSVGLPEAIAAPVAGMATGPKGQRYVSRAQRFATFGAQSPENEDKLRKAWRTLQRVISDPDGVFGLFLQFPDAPTAQPFAKVYGRRAVYKQHETPDSLGLCGYTLAREITPAEERAQYREWAAADDAVLNQLFPRTRALRHLLADAAATGGDVADLARRYREQCADFKASLPLLRELLLAVKPEAKSPTDHTKAESGAVANYHIQLAELNRFLSTPKPAAIACLANINCPSVPVKRNTIGATGGRNKKKSD